MIGGRMVTGMGPARSTLGLAPLVVATVLLALVVAGSTAVAGWVPVAEPLGGLALAAPFAALAAATPARQSSGGRPPATWWSELLAGRAAHDPTLQLFLLGLLLWL